MDFEGSTRSKDIIVKNNGVAGGVKVRLFEPVWRKGDYRNDNMIILMAGPQCGVANPCLQSRLHVLGVGGQVATGSFAKALPVLVSKGF